MKPETISPLIGSSHFDLDHKSSEIGELLTLQLWNAGGGEHLIVATQVHAHDMSGEVLRRSIISRTLFKLDLRCNPRQ